jgi:hypothetical protein
MNPFTVGLPAFLAGTFFGYILREFSVGRLTALELGTLDVNMRPVRLRYLFSMVVTIAAFAALRFSLPKLMNFWFLLFLSLCAIETVGFELYGWRRFIVGKFSRAFIAPYTVSRILTVSGILVLIVAMAATVLV